ncbi:MAG: hypothetical protein JSR95_15100, partial [Proteobacteria bacterium]|nr:hypothetical protein [Pseudomonadota bacterium]
KWNAELERRLVEGCEAQAGGRKVAQIEARRNAILVDMMKLFRKHGIGSGLTLERELGKKRPEKKAAKPAKKAARRSAGKTVRKTAAKSARRKTARR